MDLSIMPDSPHGNTPQGVIRILSRGTILAGDFSPDGTNPFTKLLGNHWTSCRVCINLAETDHIDSSAIGWLISSVRQMRAAGGLLAIHSLQPEVRKVLEMLRIGKIVPLLDDETAALALLSASKAP